MNDDRDSILRDHLVIDRERGTIAVSQPEKVFFEDCAPAEAARAARLLVPEPLTPPAGPPVTLTDENFGQIPRVYIECLADLALNPRAQRKMYTMTPCCHVYRMLAGHAPFLSDPDSLAEHLLDAEARFARR